MENFLRLSIKINRGLCILILFVSALSYLVDKASSKSESMWGIIISLIFMVLLIVMSVLAKKGLALIIDEDDSFKAFKVMRAGIVIGTLFFIVSILGLALGISTGTVSYLYILLILATGFYVFSMWKVRPPKPDESANERRDVVEPLLDVIHEIPQTEFHESKGNH